MSGLGEFTGEPGKAAPRGFRWWRISPAGEIFSAWFDLPWDPESNEATCALPVSRLGRRAWAKRHAEGVPAHGCSCGFYALHRMPFQDGTQPDPDRPWLLDPAGWSGRGASVVFGVAEAWGRVLIGTQGWRARHSRVLALFVPQGSELWESERLRLVASRYNVPITASLESLEAEWAPEPVVVIPEAEPAELDLVPAVGTNAGVGEGPSGPAAGWSAPSLVPDRWPAQWPNSGSDTRRALDARDDVLVRNDRYAAALERLAGPGPMRILELGPGAGYRASPLADRGHAVISVAGDVARVKLPGPFDVVYRGGFGAGSEDDQHDVLRQMARWIEPDGCVLVEVMTPWSWAVANRSSPGGSEWTFDPDECRVRVRVSPLWDEAAGTGEALRCYAPADLRLLLRGSGLELDAIEPFAGERFEPVAGLESATFYLAKLVPER